jgi:hypothetical protein
MISIREFASSIFGAEISAPVIDSQDLSRYRDFRFGATLLEIAEQGYLWLT